MAVDISLSNANDGLRVLTTKEAPEGFGRGLPMGPSAVRFIDNSLWAVDSIAGRFVEFDLAGKEQKAVTVKDGDKLVIADFAFQKDAAGKLAALWAVGSERADLVKIDLEGKVLASFVTDLCFPAQLELLPQNRLAVLDQGLSVVFIYDETGRKLWQHQCLGKGFVAEANGDLLFLSRKQEAVALSRRVDATGLIVELCELPVGVDANPSLLMSRENGELIFSFHSLSEASGEPAYNISRISVAGKPMASMTTAFPAAFINRVIVAEGEKLFLVSFIEENNKYILRLSDFAPTMIEEASQG